MKSADDLLSRLRGTHGTTVSSDENGRINLEFDSRSQALIQHVKDLLAAKEDGERPLEEQKVNPGTSLRKLNIVIQIVGSRGDVQPFVALGKKLKEMYGHRVRLATHATFKKFVEDNGLEFFNIGGDPADLMAFMVKNPGLLPGLDTIKGGDIGRHRRTMFEIIKGCWRSCLEAGDGMNYEPHNHYGPIRHRHQARRRNTAATYEPFIADAIIANPPSFAHVHIAERMGIPLHIFFTMPWSPTHVFPHPIANIHSKKDDKMLNYMSYGLVELLTWQGLGDIVNKFRKEYLHLDPLNLTTAPGILSKLRIRHTYCWSPTLIPKPYDWGPEVDVCGFFFLPHQSNFEPDKKLVDFLDAGKPPVYIGFGSIVVKDATAFTKLIFEAVQIAGVRALVSKGWGGLGAEEIGIPDSVLLLGDTPHDWLFPRVAAVVHHGGAGTTAAGILAGKPTIVIPFFGDQPWWGAQVAAAGAGPEPIPYKHLTAQNLAEAITKSLQPEMLEKAEEMGQKVRLENGCEEGAKSFASTLQLMDLHCDIFADRHAVWRLKGGKIKLSGLAAVILLEKGLINPKDIRVYRPCEYDTEDRRWGLPLVALGTAVSDTLMGIFGGLAEYPGLAKNAYLHASYHMHHHHDEEKAEPIEPNETSAPIEKILSNQVKDEKNGTPNGTTNHTTNGTSNGTTTHRTTYGTPNGTNTTHAPNHTDVVGDAINPNRASSVGTDRPTFFDANAEYPTGAVHLSNAPFGAVFLDRTIGTGRGMGAVIGSIINFPLLFFLNISKGFHRFPILWGDPTVRPLPRVTGFHSGLKAAGTTLGYGFVDAVVGIGKLPYIGGKAAGARGAMVGSSQALVGVLTKPMEGIFGVPGYALEGIHKEVLKYIGKNVREYVKEVRVVQAEQEIVDWKGGEADKNTVVETWEKWRRTKNVPRKYRI